MYYSVSPLVKSSYTADRQFALCESCFWSATILRSRERNVHIINSCPICSSDSISLIPLTNDDVYELRFRSKGGLEIKFSRANKL
jgi:hypothetical protein